MHDNVSISNSIIMEGCVIKSGARIGGTGFGFEMKTKQKINHSGNVVIGKNSSIGSNTTIDRAVFDSTIVGEYSNLYTSLTLFKNLTSNVTLSFGIIGFLNLALLTLINNTDFSLYSLSL